MDALKLLIIAVLSCLIGFGLPALIFLLATRGSGLREIQALQRMSNVSSAMKSRNRDLEELSQRVADLRAAGKAGSQKPGGGPDGSQF